MKKKLRLKKKYRIVLEIIFIVMIIVPITLFFIRENQGEHPKVKLNENNEKIKNPENNYSEVIKNLKKLKMENPDTFGYLIIPDTKINYPVMYTKGEDYYEYRDFYKKKVAKGSLFINKHNTINPLDHNLIIYGHNMKNGTMFGDLPKYLKRDYLDKHKTVYFVTDAVYEYEIISVFKSAIYGEDEKVFKFYKAYDFKSEAEFNNYYKNIKRMSIYKDLPEAQYGDELITLCTCFYHVENGRLAVVLRKVEKVE